jgi:hypothetical protein
MTRTVPACQRLMISFEYPRVSRPERDIDPDRFVADEVDEQRAAVLEGRVAQSLGGRGTQDHTASAARTSTTKHDS